MKNKFKVLFVSIVFIGLVGCSNSDEEVIAVETPANIENDSGIVDNTSSNTVDSSITSSNSNASNSSTVKNQSGINNTDPSYPDSHSKVSGGNTGNTWLGQ